MLLNFFLKKRSTTPKITCISCNKIWISWVWIPTHFINASGPFFFSFYWIIANFSIKRFTITPKVFSFCHFTLRHFKPLILETWSIWLVWNGKRCWTRISVCFIHKIKKRKKSHINHNFTRVFFVSSKLKIPFVTKNIFIICIILCQIQFKIFSISINLLLHKKCYIPFS